MPFHGRRIGKQRAIAKSFLMMANRTFPRADLQSSAFGCRQMTVWEPRLNTRIRHFHVALGHGSLSALVRHSIFSNLITQMIRNNAPSRRQQQHRAKRSGYRQACPHVYSASCIGSTGVHGYQKAFKRSTASRMMCLWLPYRRSFRSIGHQTTLMASSPRERK